MVNAYDLPLALFAFFGIVAIVPAWMYFLSAYADGLPTEARFLAQLALPALCALFLASWVG